MKTDEVNALVSSIIRSDASPQIAGFLYQFVIAVDYCFQLQPGQSLYIEKYGDVAIKSDGSFDGEANDTSIEVKLYADELGVRHHNLLNTLYNWLEDDFNFTSYRNLIIYTTQPIAKNSVLAGWEKKTPAQRLKVVSKAYTAYLKDNKERIEGKDSKKHPTISQNASMMKRVLGSVQKKDGTIDENASNERLQDLLSRVVILDSCKGLSKSYNELLKYAKVTTENLREAYINSLLGFVISPKNMENGWKIEEETFTKQVQLLAKEMAPQSMVFPDAPNITVKEGDYDDALFVKKLRAIDYKRITQAVIDFAKTTGLLTGEFDRPSAEKNLANYQEEILRLYHLKYDTAVDSLYDGRELTDDDIKRTSRIFLGELLQATHSIAFEPFGVTKSYFSEGMCHYVANDDRQNVNWLLEDE